MKFLLFTVSSVLIICCLIDSIHAAGERHKRYIGREKCPEHKTFNECVEYARLKAQSDTKCTGYSVGGSFHWIQYHTCMNVECGGGAKYVPEDRTKAYPDCCARCE